MVLFTTSPATGKGFWAALGPGLITGASDENPSRIATYSQAGAVVIMFAAWQAESRSAMLP